MTRDPELRYLANGTACADISIAINKKYEKNGEKKEEVSFIEVTCWARTAENVAQYLHKGDPVLVEGEIKQERWETDDGKQRSKTKVVAKLVHFLGTKKADAAPAAPSSEEEVAF